MSQFSWQLPCPSPFFLDGSKNFQKGKFTNSPTVCQMQILIHLEHLLVRYVNLLFIKLNKWKQYFSLNRSFTASKLVGKTVELLYFLLWTQKQANIWASTQSSLLSVPCFCQYDKSAFLLTYHTLRYFSGKFLEYNLLN